MHTCRSFSSLRFSQQAILLHGSFKPQRRHQYHIPKTSSRRSSASVRADVSLQKAIEIRNKKGERDAYLFAALASSLGLTSMAAGAVYYRFAWEMGGEIPLVEAFGMFAFAIGASSHHSPRAGLFELNDVFGIINCIPATSLMGYGFFNHGLLSGLSFGAGLGITVHGMAYMFVHDGLIHKRFPLGPLANVPCLQKVSAALQLHHADKFNGVPYGLFLGPEDDRLQELEEAGGSEELARLIKARQRHGGGGGDNDNESAEGLNL